MEVNYSPSINIIRDANKELNYTVTPNAERVVHQIVDDFKKGFHSFNLIGSYGTGKSSFLWALENSLQGKENYFDIVLPIEKSNVRFLNFVGTYQSIIGAFSEQLAIKNKLTGNQEILDAIYQEYEKAGEKNGLLVIVIDELGKFLEFAANHQPEKELYFIQQLAEFANDGNRNILFLSSLHQSFEAYSNALTEMQRKEWVKVKGRLKELTFNEPVEQLLLLASKHFTDKFGAKVKSSKNVFSALNEKANIFPVSDEFTSKIEQGIYPMELFSAYGLTLALQRYGQNERSLFTFLESTDHLGINHWNNENSPLYNLSNVYDYLFYNYYSFLSTKYNPHYAQWAGMKSAIERADALVKKNLLEALQLIKSIGLLNLFGSKGASLDSEFFSVYAKNSLGINKAAVVLDELQERQIIRFSKYDQSYKLTEGTDVDIEVALQQAGNKVNKVTDIVGALNEHFDLPYLTAKSVSYLKGTPRNFKFIISEGPNKEVLKDEIDGYINLIFDDQLSETALAKVSAATEEAILYGYYKNSKQIKELLFEIEKTEKVLTDNQEDNVAKRELKNILDHQKNLLNHYVLDDLYSDKISWFFQGEKKKIENKKQFNRLLSEICDVVYSNTPIYRNELVNKHKIPGQIHLARKSYFEALVNHWGEQGLGFESNKFPPEKTIYLTLLKENGMHRKVQNGWELSEPDEHSSFDDVWRASENFLESARQEKKQLTDLIEILAKRPFKLKQGLIDFWVPTFLFIKQGDFALYEKGSFIPAINEIKLYETTRNPQHYEFKAFEITGVRKRLFEKYRAFLKQKNKDQPDKEAFIESVRPFLVFYKDLPDYCKRTEQLSAEAIALRTAIINADDPEKVFFEDFPTALRISIQQMAKSDEAMMSFISSLDEAIKEIKNAYNELLNRVESFMQEEVIGKKIEFSGYKKRLKNRFSTIKDHQLLPRQKTFVQRINSSIDDRDSWIASITQAVLQKPLHQIRDNEEYVLKDKLLHMVRELDNLREIHKKETPNNEIIKFDLTTSQGGLKSRFIEIPKGKSKEVGELSTAIYKLLEKHPTLSTAVLAKLLNEQLNNG